ncbi:MAG: L,D-transpeptidase Cds6 family protein [Fibrobacterota bacterium]
MKKLIRRALLRLKKTENNIRIRFSRWQIQHAYEDKTVLRPILFRGVVAILLLVVTIAVLRQVMPVAGPAAHFPVSQSADSGRGSAREGEGSSSLSRADTAVAESQNLQKKIAPQRLRRRDGTFRHLIVADKNDKVLHVLERDSLYWKHQRTFPFASGARGGVKEREGDLKTPEGIYFIVDKIDGRGLNEIYGPFSFVLNYPNRYDRENGKTGGGIWIHGTSPDQVPVQTKGCLELHNFNLEKLDTLLNGDSLVPVVIHNRGGMDFNEIVDLKAVIAERNHVLQQREAKRRRAQKRDSLQTHLQAFARRWARAWESMDMSRYKQFYDTAAFSVPGYDWQRWEKRKARTFERYSRIEITFDTVEVALSGDTAADLIFRQRYRSNLFNSVNKKTLSLHKTGENWKIIKEISGP